MENAPTRKKHKVCENITDLVVGDVLVWDNSSGNSDCVVTKCQPALECDKYTILAHDTTDANVVAKSDQFYKCKCHKHAVTDPKLIVK